MTIAFAQAFVSTSSGEFDVSAFCTDVGVLLRHAAKVLRSGVLGFARDRCSYVNHADLRWNRVSLPNLADALPPQQCCQLPGDVVTRGGRHGILQWHRSSTGTAFHVVLEPMIRFQGHSVC